jgi:squalene-hopene/tetraprenyl-beta-curcumene cyclase
MNRHLLLLLLPGLTYAAEAPKPKPKPSFQYQSAGIQVSIPTAEEPRVKAFGPDTIKAAAKYLEDGSLSWVREKTCINCHTTGPYMTERPALTTFLGIPTAEILADFVEAVPTEIKPQNETEKDGHRYFAGSWTSIWRSLGLAEWDKHVAGKLSTHTDRSLREMFTRQLTLQAARAITAAPGWLENLKDGDLLARVDKMKAWLRDAPPKNDFDRVLRLQLAHYMPELVTKADRAAAMALLTSKQHADGGWSTRDMSPVNDWHYKMSDTVLKVIASLPDAAKPESDAYMTALAVVLLRQSGVPPEDDRIRRALAWLKREQRVSGRWWMHSLYRGNYHYITYIATCQALKALALCGEIPG